MTILTGVEHRTVNQTVKQTVQAFDSLAARYDEMFTRSIIGRAQRGAVWKVLSETFKPGDHILEINCGTGEDALFLARNGVSVVACDASEQMIRTARQRMGAEDPDARIHFEVLPTEQLFLRPDDLFDGALSNFSGLNCVANLQQTARDLAALVTPGGPVLLCLSTRFCLAEMIWFAAHGHFYRAFRRSTGMATAKVNGFSVKVQYPTLRAIKGMFAPYFLLRSCTGIGIAVPPSYLEPWARKYPRMLGLLRRIDERISRLPWLRTIGDHMLLHFERVEV
jgi:ubiquinone/menaquinone biosynthesis C-methylase UbiE